MSQVTTSHDLSRTGRPAGGLEALSPTSPIALKSYLTHRIGALGE